MDKTDSYRMPSPAARILREKKILIILPPTEFDNHEFEYLCDFLKKAGLSFKIASSRSAPVSSSGAVVKTAIQLSDAVADDFDAVLIIGDASGARMTQFASDPNIMRILKKADGKKRIIAATGMATLVLASADMLKGKMVTSWRDPELVSLIKSKGASFQWEPVVSDGTLITSDGPTSIRVFADMLIDALTR